MSGLIAIVGRPNVGKSALFNRMVGRRIAIVHDEPGVTRDRVMAEAEWHGHRFTMVDTGGIGLLRGEKVVDTITIAALQQVEMAIEAANVIILVVNVQDGILPLDREVSAKLRSAGKTVLVAVNKVDDYRAQNGVGEFAALGFEQIFPVTAIHGRGIEALMDCAFEYLPKDPAPEKPVAEAEEVPERPADGREPRVKPMGPKTVRLAIVGRPNVGKSSIINALTGSQRVIVSPIPGTTRDAIDVPFQVMTEGVAQNYMLVDTAGVRKSRRVNDSIEFFSVERTKDAIARADIVVLVLDAENGITEQDKKIADVIVENHRACIIVVNKWDLVSDSVRKAREEEIQVRKDHSRDRDDREKRLTTLADFGAWVQERLFFLDYAPVIFTSATEGFQLERLLEAIRYVTGQLEQRVPTAILNRTLNDAVEKRQPISAVGHRLKFFYATQVKPAPPTFLLFVNRQELFNPTYTKYLCGSLRTAFGYEGCPIVLVAKARPKTVASIRKYNSPNAGKDADAQPVRETRGPRGRTSERPGGSSRGKPSRSKASQGAPTKRGFAKAAPSGRPAKAGLADRRPGSPPFKKKIKPRSGKQRARLQQQKDKHRR
ncbi:MAG TPA: ribosome biogenesis GTPase Der [Candidatus Limnocylindria bacterium]|jgi:GTP-binding protein|nr:ribosome biogenesis GTPase Der [Candidatus Limnocylindria bacterium]